MTAVLVEPIGPGSGTWPTTPDYQRRVREFGAAYTAEGLITLAGSRLLTSMADTDEVVDDALARFERVLTATAVA